MKLSIIVPVYNCSKTIEKTFNSIVPQLNDDCEAIFIDDGSKDDSLSKLELLKKRSNKNILIFSQENKGLLGARKSGIEKANGDYCWFVDGGDAITNNALDVVLQKIVENKYIDVFYVNHIRDENNIEIEIKDYKEGYLLKPENMLLGKIAFSICFKIVKKSLLMKCKVFDEHEILLGEDACITFELLTLTDNVYFIDDYLYIYIKDFESITMSNSRNFNITKAIKYIESIILYKNLSLQEEFHYFVFNQIIIQYLLFSSSRKDYQKFIEFYKSYNFPKTNKYIRKEKLFMFLAFIKNRTLASENLVSKILLSIRR